MPNTTTPGPVVISLAVQKGGVGKTFIATHLACYIQQVLKQRVLVVDMDLSGVASRRLLLHDGTIPDDVTSNVACLQAKTWAPASSRFGVDVIPAFPGHDTHEQIHELFSRDRYLLRQSIRQQDYDYIIIDGYPVLDARLEGCLLASDYVVSVGEPSTDDVKGMHDVWYRLKELSEGGHTTPAHIGYVLNKIRPRSPVAMRQVKKVVRSMGYLAFSNSISQRDPIANACNDSRLIWELPPGQARVASLEIEDVCEEILEKIAEDQESGCYQNYETELGGLK